MRSVRRLTCLATLMTTPAMLLAQDGGRRSSVVQRPPVAPPETGGGSFGRGPSPAVYPTDVRTIDGTNNNVANPTWGAAGINLLRLVPADYADGVGSPSGAGRPSPREISNIFCDQGFAMPNPLRATSYLWQWGQFLDHDIDETPVDASHDAFDIVVASGDPWFDPTNLGTVTIGLDRSAFTMVEGRREQLNNITAFIDASNVYGSDDVRALALRTADGTGKLKVSPDGMMPFNTTMLPNAPTPFDPGMFLAGDVRANEQIGLTSMHTLFVREHNHWAEIIRGAFPTLTGDEVYERARAIVGAEMQAITYNEFLPALMGSNPLPPYDGYKPDVDPSISNVFATAAYRFGHTMLSPMLLRLDETGAQIEAGNLPLMDAFFTPLEVMDNGIDPVLRGLAVQPAQNVDTFLIDDVRNFLFGQPGAGGFDLASLNIQRGRDHGIGSYNDVRVAFGLLPAPDFQAVNPDPAVFVPLSQSYATPDDIDAWVGMLAEPHLPQTLVGETLFAVLADQFTRLRDGDRFWYTTYLPQEMVDLVEAQTLSEIIRRNTAIGDELQDDVFHLPGCVADVDQNGSVDVADVIVYLGAWFTGAMSADVDGDGLVQLADLLLFLDSYFSGCA